MAASIVPIFYSVAQRKRRETYILDSDAEIVAFRPRQLRPGEAYLEQSMADYKQRGPDAAVQDVAGGPPLSDNCVCVDLTGKVFAVHPADPVIDKASDIPGAAQMINTTDQNAVIGATYLNGIFTVPVTVGPSQGQML